MIRETTTFITIAPSLCNGIFPLPWGHACLRLENLVEMGMRRQTALQGDVIIAKLWVLPDHALSLLETDVAEPHPKRTAQITLKILTQVTLRNLQLLGKRNHVGGTITESSLLTPLLQGFLYQRHLI